MDGKYIMAYNLFMEVKLFVGKSCRPGAGKRNLCGGKCWIGVADEKGKLVGKGSP